MVSPRILAVVLCLTVGTVKSFLLDQPHYSGNGETAQFWRNQAKADILKTRKQQRIVDVAKNVILFIGDGMSVPTITASRILKGQMQGKTGEETVLSFEKFPNSGLSKTYCQDHTTSDSAATGTAFHSGVKTNMGTIGVDGRARYGDCASSKGAEVTSIVDWSIAAGKSVGIVTTTRVTDATPASAYANTPARYWEGDHYTQSVSGGCKDIAAQLIDDYPEIEVIMGGGRRFFRRYDQPDPEHGSNAHYGRRDGRDLLKEWADGQHKLNRNSQYVWNATAFHSVDPATTDSLMGLFSYTHMNYELERTDPNHESAGEPSLAEMTEKAIQILSKNPKGFYLLVEGGNIDHGHHAGRADLALHDVLALQDAVAKGDALTNENDTLVIVTADHSHTMTLVGYPSRGNPILGKVDDGSGHYKHASDGKPFTTLLYANGPGFSVTNGHRTDISNVDTTDKHYLQQAAVPLSIETHAGDDVAIFSRGPMSHLLNGVHEEHTIAHVMAYASCVGDYSHHDDCAASEVANRR